MIKKVVLFATIFVIFTFSEGHAQIRIGKIIKDSKNKIIKETERRVEREITDYIVRKSMKSINREFDKMVTQAYANDTLENGEIDWEKIGTNYQELLQSMDRSADVPDSYNFDLMLDAEFVSYDDEKSMVRFYYNKEADYIGFEQEEDGITSFIIMDNERDIIVMLQEEDGQKTGRAIPNMLGMAALAASEIDSSAMFFTLRKTGKTKKIAGYNTWKYEGENADDNLEAYAAPDFPYNWVEKHFAFLERFTPENYSEQVSKIEGTLLASKNVSKKDKKLEASFEVKKVHQKDFEFKKVDYNFNAQD